jgi:Fis family transcriptional regulator
MMNSQIEMARRANVQQPPLRDIVQSVVQQHLTTITSTNKITDLYDRIISEMERALIERVLDYTGGNESRTAKILGISRGTLRQRRKRFGHYEEVAKTIN